MKKGLWLVPLALVIFAAGCGQQAKPSSTTQSSSQVKKAKKTKKAKKQTADKASAQSESAATSSSAATTTPVTRVATLKAQVQKLIPGAKFPTHFTAPAGQALNVSATGNASDYTLAFSTGAAQDVNAQGLPTTTAPLVLTKTTPTGQAAATEAEAGIHYRESETGLPTVALGDGLLGTREGAAGSVYVTWHEGRWSLVTIGVSQNNEDPVALAKQVVAVLAKDMLPIPAVHGAIELHVGKSDQRANTVSWREDSAYYQLSGLDAMQTINFAVTLR